MQILILKRIIDILLSIIILIFLSPLMVILFILVKFSSPGPVFFKGERVGRNFKKFCIYKFRTMKIKSDFGKNRITTIEDPRITRVGSILRRWKLDELPNFYNVLKGDMSIVGPRPETSHYVDINNPKHKKVLSIKPGITCIAQIRYPDEQSILGKEYLNDHNYNEHRNNKLELDILYIDTISHFGDILIILVSFLLFFGIVLDLESYFRKNYNKEFKKL